MAQGRRRGKYRRAAALLVIGVFAGACGGTGPPPDRRTEAAPPAPVVQRLRAVALADERYRLLPRHEARIADRVAAASDHLAAVFGLPIDLVRVEAWTPPSAARGLEAWLAAAEEHPLPSDADLLLAFTASPLQTAPRVDDVVRSRYAGRVIVLRSLTPLFPSADDVHTAEVRALLRGVATIFGALPDCGPLLMANRPAFRLAEGVDVGWSDLNLALIRAHGTMDLRADPRLPADIARRAAQLLAPGSPGLPACAPDDLRARRALLEERPRPAAPSEPAATATVSEMAGRDPATAVRDLRAWLLHHPDDRDATLALARVVGREGDDAAARALLHRWVAAHPDDAEAWLNLGVAHARLGDIAAARAAWETVLRLAPGHPDASALLRRLPR